MITIDPEERSSIIRRCDYLRMRICLICAFKLGNRQKVMRIKIVACNVDFHIKKKSCNPTQRTRDTAFLLNGTNAILNWPSLLIATLLRRLSWFSVIRITSPNIPPNGALSRRIIPKNSNFHYGPRTKWGTAKYQLSHCATLSTRTIVERGGKFHFRESVFQNIMEIRISRDNFSTIRKKKKC